MGAQHIRGGAIHLTQEKTGAALAIPVHPALAAIIASSSRDHLTFLVTRFGAPFGASAFSHWFRDRCNEAGLPHCSAHGLRKAAARVLAEAGCTAHEIGAITGHSSLWRSWCATPRPRISAGLPRRPWRKREHLFANLLQGLRKKLEKPLKSRGKSDDHGLA